MSYRGRSRGFSNNFGKQAAYPYRGDNNRYSQHDDRSRGGGPSYRGRDKESGEYYNSRHFQNGRYEHRGRGGGKFRGRRPSRRGVRGRGGSYRGSRGGSSSGEYIDKDGDIDMEGGESGRARPTPYSRPQRGKPQRTEERFPQNRREPRWSLITVVQGGMLDREWVIEAIQKEAMVQIKPVQYYNDGENASFCIQDENVAQNIKDCNRKITAPDGSKLLIWRSQCGPPITDEKLPILKEVLSNRYNTETLHLDASALFLDKNLRSNGIELKPKFSKDMYILISMIGEHIPGLVSLDVSNNRIDTLSHLKNLVVVTPRLKCLKLEKNYLKYAKELDNVREWDLLELNLNENPLCENYKSQSDYISAMRDRFPNLETLDGKKLPPPVKFDLEKVTKLVPPVPNHIPPQVTQIIKQFVKQYFELYDKDRGNVTQAYDENCLFSLCIPTSPRGPPLSQYYSHSRNLQRMKNPKNKISTLRKSRAEICSVLQELPKTEHDVAGFFVDVPLVSSTLLKFVIRGVFKERSSAKEKVHIRAFTRAFLCLTDGSRLSIINEELYIRNVTSVELRSAFAKPPVTPSPSPVPEHVTASPASSVNASGIGSPSKLDMVAAFCKDSGMNHKYSEQCLNENGWDYSKAGQAFMAAKEKGLIPPEAFVQ